MNRALRLRRERRRQRRLVRQFAAGQAFRYALRVGTILLSNSVVAELADVLARPKFDKYLLPQERSAFLQSLIDEGELVEITETFGAPRNPKDDKFLELAVSGRASHVVTGDDDLLVLNPFRGIPILTPAAFLIRVDPNPGQT